MHFAFGLNSLFRNRHRLVACRLFVTGKPGLAKVARMSWVALDTVPSVSPACGWPVLCYYQVEVAANRRSREQKDDAEDDISEVWTRNGSAVDVMDKSFDADQLSVIATSAQTGAQTI
jgi:hypothetical protein